MRSAFIAALLVSGAAACGGDDGGSGAIDAPSGTDAASGDGGDTDAATDGGTLDAPAAFALTSTAITEGGVIADMYSCQGTNVSPPLAWTGGPTAPGYAIVLTDTNNNLVHSAIWDSTRGYLGPCPGSMHTYQFAIYAVDANPLPGVGTTLGMGSTRNQVVAAILAHDTAMATLTATFTP